MPERPAAGPGPLAVAHPGEDDDVLLELARAAVAPAAGPTPQRLADLEARVRRAVAHGRSEATLRAYTSDWADFATWCATIGFDPLPAAAGSVAGYVSELAFPPDDRDPAAVSTITRRLAAIGQVHSLARQPNPCADALVREAMRGVRRALGVAPRHQKRAVTTEEVKAAVAQLGEGLAEMRDKVVLLVGFAGGMRRSELAGIAVTDVEAAPEGMLVHLRRSKTDPEARGRRIEIVYGTDPATCPVRAYRTWVRAAGIAEGPVLRRVDRHGRLLGPLSAQGVAIVVKRHMGRLGHPVSDFAGHSLRRGHATTAARNGATERTIMATTGHTSVETLRGYIDDAQLFSDPASSYLGL
ncbi:MAG: site-specific integrase [Acidimicrobiales bacterium]